MITQTDINLKRSYFQLKHSETNGAKWVIKELDFVERLQATFDQVEQQRFKIYELETDLERAFEMLQYVESVFDSLGFLGESAFLFSKNPKPLSGFYTLQLLRLLPKDHDFKNALNQYWNDFSNRQNKAELEKHFERQTTPNPYPNQYQPLSRT